MAKTDKTIKVDGLSIDDIMDIDLDTFNKLGERDLRAITSRLVSASNKRIRAINKRGLDSPAIRSLGTRTAFSTKLPKGTDIKQRVNKLRQEFSRARKFLTMKTSTIGGARKYHREVINTIEKGIGRPLTSEENVSRVFNLLHKAQERGLVPSKDVDSIGSKQARKFIFDIMKDYPDASEKDIIDMLDADYHDWVEHQEDEMNEDETEETEIDS